MRARLVRIDAVLVQAAIAAALSFAHLHDIANAAGQHGWKAWAYPVSVDLLLVAAWRRLGSGRTKGAAWCWFAISLAASLGANVATAGLLDVHAVPAWLRILVAGWPAVAFLGRTLRGHIRHLRVRCLLQNRPLPNWPPHRQPPPNRPPWSPTHARSPPTTAPVPANPSTPRPSAPASASPHRSPTPSPPSSERRTHKGGGGGIGAERFSRRRRLSSVKNPADTMTTGKSAT